MPFGEKDFERTPLSPNATKHGKWKIFPSISVQEKSTSSNGPNEAVFGERSQSLDSFGDNSKKSHQTLSVPISDVSEEQKRSTKNLSHMIDLVVFSKKTTRLSKRCKRLNTLLLEAVRYQAVSEIEKLIIAGGNPNATCCMNSISACHLAAMRSDGALALLLSHGANKFRSDRIGRTPIHLAAWAGNVRQMTILLGFSKDVTHQVSLSMIRPAGEEEVQKLSQFVNMKCSNFSPEQAILPKEWLDNTIDHNCKDFDKSLPLLQPGWTPLHVASSRANSHCTQLLLAAGADASLRDLVGRSPLDIAGSTYYSNHPIDPHCFAETVSLLTGENYHFSFRNRKTFDSPLHTAVELGSVEAVRHLLSVGVPIDWLNRAGLTPLHVSVKNKLGDILQVLIHDSLDLDKETNYQAVVELRDKDGRTILHASVSEGWEHGVSIALEAGVNIYIKDNFNETALHVAATTGNLNILNRIIDAAQKDNILHETTWLKETPLIKSVRMGHTECVKRLLEEKSSIRQTLPNQINVFHLAAEKGFVDVLQVLLDHDYTLTRGMINFLTDDKDGFGPLHYAVQNNHPLCVKLLLSRNAYRCLKTSVTGVHNGSTPLHLAAKHNNTEIANIILKNNLDSVHYFNGQDWTPLHTACIHGSRDMIVLLLKKGAGLSCTGTNNKNGTTALDLIMNNLSNPTEFMNHIFDEYIYTNDTFIQDPNCEITIDYTILLPVTGEKHRMKVIEVLLKTGDRHEQTQLLVHPLLESFLYIEWKALLPLFFIKIVTYGVYVVYLTTYAVLMFYFKDNGYEEPTWTNPIVLSIPLYLICFKLVALEASYIIIKKRYIYYFENWVKFGSILLALSLPISITSYVDEPRVEYPRYIATLSLLLSWVELMILMSRFPTLGYYVLMFGKVSCNVLKILSTFSFLVIGFSISFMIMFHHQSPFENPIAALIKTLVMLNSEYDYSNLMEDVKRINHSNSTSPNYSSYSLLIIRLIFFLFIVLAAIVLMNLMVGVAVNDLQDLQLLGKIRRLTKQVEFQVSLEKLLCNRYAQKILSKTIARTFMNKRTVDNIMVLRPSEPNSKLYKSLPSDIRNSIFEKARLQKNQMEEDIGIKTYRKKLDEIHNAIMEKQENIVTKEPSYEVGNMAKYIAELDSRIVDYNKQVTQSLNEMRYSINTQMDTILDKLSKIQGPQGRHYLKPFTNDKF